MGLPPELCKEVMRVIFDYAFDNIEPEEGTDAVVKGFYLAFKSRFDMNTARLERNKENGKKGGNPNFSKGKRNPYYQKRDNLNKETDNRDITEDYREDNPTDNQEITEDNPSITENIIDDITEREDIDNRKISEDKAYLYPYQYLNNNSVVDVVDNAHARERENNRKFLDEFFNETHRAQIEVICMQLHTNPDTLRREAEEVIAEWELTKVTHNDYKEQAQHLINQLRIKYRSKLQENGRGTKKAGTAGATAKSEHSSVCGSTTKKKPLRSTI